MSVVAQRKITRGPAKIIPFPVARSTIEVKRTRVTQWIYWTVLLMLASIGGEIWSSYMSAAAVNRQVSGHGIHSAAGGSIRVDRHAGT